MIIPRVFGYITVDLKGEDDPIDNRGVEAVAESIDGLTTLGT